MTASSCTDIRKQTNFRHQLRELKVSIKMVQQLDPQSHCYNDKKKADQVRFCSITNLLKIHMNKTEKIYKYYVETNK